MRTIQQYMDTAIERQELGSDRQLAKKIGLSNTSITFWRTGKSLPAPDTMVKLAYLAGIDEQVALVELSFMGAPEGGAAKSTYEKILKRISSFLPATLFGLFALHPDTAHAAETVGRIATSMPNYGITESVSSVAIIMYLMEINGKTNPPYYSTRSI